MHRTLDDLAAEIRPTVFRLLDAGKAHAAADLVETYAVEADAALWYEVLGLTEVDGEATPVEADHPAPVVEPTAVQPPEQARPGKGKVNRARAGAGGRARAAVGR